MKPEDKRAFMAWYLDFGFAGDSSQQEKVWQAACAHRDAQPAVAVNEQLLEALKELMYARTDKAEGMAEAAIAQAEAAKGV